MSWLGPVEAAAALVRDAGPRALAMYLVGALPLTLALIEFATDMMRSPYAQERLPGGSLLVAVAFLWKQCWQAAYMAELRDGLAGSATAWSAGRVWRLVARQAAWQPWSLVAIPVAWMAVVPGVWVFGFFRHLALEAGGGGGRGWRALANDAMRGGQAPFVAAPVFGLGGAVLMVNVFVLVVSLPHLALSFFGVRSIFTTLGAGVVNGLTMFVAAALTWLLLDPLIDAYFVQRAFAQESRATALDLRAALRRALPVLVLLAAAPLQAIDTQQFDRAAEDVLRQEEFAWRARGAGGPEGPVESWFRRVDEYLERKLSEFSDWVRRTFFSSPERDNRGGGLIPASAVRGWLIVLGGVVVLLVAALLIRYWRNLRPGPELARAATVTRVNVADERIGAEALEEEAWLSLADELMAQGDFRLAMRALHLAGLRWLAGRELVALERWKTGSDYARELERRTRHAPAMAAGFRGNLRWFEMVWYGRHDVDPEGLTRYRDAWKEMRAHA